jgi:hypothetical protein
LLQNGRAEHPEDCPTTMFYDEENKEGTAMPKDPLERAVLGN